MPSSQTSTPKTNSNKSTKQTQSNKTTSNINSSHPDYFYSLSNKSTNKKRKFDEIDNQLPKIQCCFCPYVGNVFEPRNHIKECLYQFEEHYNIPHQCYCSFGEVKSNKIINLTDDGLK